MFVRWPGGDVRLEHFEVRLRDLADPDPIPVAGHQTRGDTSGLGDLTLGGITAQLGAQPRPNLEKPGLGPLLLQLPL